MRRNLTKNEKIKKQADFNELFSASLNLSCRGLKVFYSKNELERSRLGISVSRRYGKAVFRNYIKRVIRELFRLNKNSFSSSFDLLFIPYPGDFVYEDRRKQFCFLMEKAGILNKNS